jgi:hypothetical protein
MNKIYLTLIIILLPVSAYDCSANDSIGAIGVGGIEFKKTDEISMEKEVLTISLDKIRVEYEFLNKSNKPIIETIFFPMPFYAYDFGCSAEYSGQLQQFKVWVNDKEVTPYRTVAAKLPDGEDVTTRLRKIGLTDEDIAEYRGITSECGDAHISGNYAASIKKLSEEKLVASPINGIPTPVWNAAYVYHWNMTFPPMQVIRVAHEYRPFTGSGAEGYEFTTNKLDDVFSKFEYSTKTSGDEEYCMTDGAVRLAKKIQERTNKPFVERTVKYVLTTGANWAGPIKDFTLNLKKRASDEIVTLCFDGDFKKSNELTLSAHLKNFVPSKELNVKFYFPHDSRYGFPFDPGPIQHY